MLVLDQMLDQMLCPPLGLGRKLLRHLLGRQILHLLVRQMRHLLVRRMLHLLVQINRLMVL